MSERSLTEDQQTHATLENHAVSLRGAITLLLAGGAILWLSAWASISGRTCPGGVEEARFVPGMGMAGEFGTNARREGTQ